ncbi:MAG: hypothetical protein F4X51_11025 [Gemmatimonadetes bacterium]|nr:hypothetical protein [Gemmatimonadota bacterium]
MKTQLELPMTDQKFDQSEIKLILSLTGNPWTDFGIVNLCEELQISDPPFLVEKPFLTENEAIIAIDVSDVETVKVWFNQMLRSRWNQIYWLSRVGKILNRSLTYDVEGSVITDEKTQIAKSDKARIKELSPQTQVKDEMPIVQARLNFIGMPADARKIKQQRETIVQNFVQNWISPQGEKVCDISGRPSDKLEKVLQMVNPFSNKHHNIKVRGFLRSNSNFELGPILHFVNLCTTFEPHIPFVYNPSTKPDPTTFLILPEIADLSLLAQVYARLLINLKNISDKRELSTSTNLRGIRRISDTYTLAITLFHNIFYRFTVESESDNESSWDFAPLDRSSEIHRQVTRWVIIPFVRKQNIRFGNFHVVEVDHRLYDFIRPIPFDNGDEIRLVPDILSCIGFSAPGGENALRHLSQAIATSDSQLMKNAIFELWKYAAVITFHPQKGAPHPVRLLRYFIQHFLEVNAVLNEELRDDLRALANTVGKVFHRDVTLISKLYNISSENSFRSVLNQIMFRLYKVSAAGAAKELFPIRQERIRHILDEMSQENWKAMAETLSTFVSLSAFNTNVFESKPQSNEGGTQ